jgi:hypothetical protein
VSATLGADEVLVEVAHASVTGRAGVGTVIATGAAASDLAARRVAFGELQACAECDACRRGRLERCQAARRTRIEDGQVVIRRRWACPLDGVLAQVAPGPEAALLGYEVALAYALLTRAGVAAGDVVLAPGDGAVPALVRALGRWLGAHAPELPASLARAELDVWRTAVQAALPEVTLPPMATWRLLITSPAWLDAAPAAEGAMVGLAGEALGQPPSRMTQGLAAGGAWFGVVAPHPDLVPEVAALCGRGAVELASRARVLAGTPPTVDFA